jgi:hypothetical protein
MRYFALILLFLFSSNAYSQDVLTKKKVYGTVINGTTSLVLPNANIININKVKGSTTDTKGAFEIDADVNDTLHITMIGFQSLRVRVTNDWIKNGTAKLILTEKAIALEEVKVKRYNLTGYLEVDTKLIPEEENFRYSISGLPAAYEMGDRSPNAFSRVMNSIFNPADMLYNFFGKKPKELRRLKEMKKDDTVKNLLETKFDRETICILLGVTKNEIAEILQHCSYSEAFIQTANDLQILDAISQCYEQYKVLKK